MGHSLGKQGRPRVAPTNADTLLKGGIEDKIVL
jgi:hypothetical protein